MEIEQSSTRLNNSAYRQREHLLSVEIDTLLANARMMPRNSQRNYCIVLLGYKHGLRAVEFSYLQWNSIDFTTATIFIKRAKGSDSGTHHLTGREIRELRKLQRLNEGRSPYVFLTETGVPMASTGISAVVKKLPVYKGKDLIGFPVHAHMLRHTCGYLLTEAGTDIRITQAWLGHREIQNTTRYTKLSSNAFKGIDI